MLLVETQIDKNVNNRKYFLILIKYVNSMRVRRSYVHLYYCTLDLLNLVDILYEIMKRYIRHDEYTCNSNTPEDSP